MQVYWSVLFERALLEDGVDALLDVAGTCAQAGYVRLSVPYMRTDAARNLLTAMFLDVSTDPDDVLVMLDCDHCHPSDIVNRLAKSLYPVVGALAFRRKPPHDPLIFAKDESGRVLNVIDWPQNAMIKVAAVGTGAIAIKRSVFDTFHQAGIRFPIWEFRYENDGQVCKGIGEDFLFCMRCEQAGVPVYCDTSLLTWHLNIQYVGPGEWEKDKVNEGLAISPDGTVRLVKKEDGVDYTRLIREVSEKMRRLT